MFLFFLSLKGGHRVRAFMNGPGLKPKVYNGLFHSTDLLPTLLDAAIPGKIGYLVFSYFSQKYNQI